MPATPQILENPDLTDLDMAEGELIAARLPAALPADDDQDGELVLIDSMILAALVSP